MCQEKCCTFTLAFNKSLRQLLSGCRVLNVLRHWVDQHFYDFEWHYELLQTLEEFLDTVKGKAMKKCVESIRKAIKRRKHSTSTERQIIHEKTPPRILWHITEKYDHFDLMTVREEFLNVDFFSHHVVASEEDLQSALFKP